MYKNIYKYDDMKRREHMAVREHVGWYLWTHQLVEVQGEDARDFLDLLCTKMISTLKTGKERYTTILDENAEIIDDVVVFRLEEQKFWVSTLFAGNLIHWMASHQGNRKITYKDVTDQYHMYAVQGPDSMEMINKLTKNNSKYLSGGGTNVEMDGVQACAYARIRYTAGDDYKRTERQRTVLTAMVQKAQKANLTTINSLIDELFGDIKTSFSNTELISLAAKVFNYSLGETIGFPFEKNTTTLGNKGSVVVPCDLESNVKQLHVFLYDDNEYAPTDTVKNNSAQIVNDTGFHQGEGY